MLIITSIITVDNRNQQWAEITIGTKQLVLRAV